MEENIKPAGKFTLSVPVAIIIAGIIIAGAVYFRGGAPSLSKSGPKQEAKAERNVAVKPISSDDHITGNPDAILTIVEYSDTECPFCKTFHKTMQQIMESYGKDGKVAWVYRHSPIVQLHSKAPKEAEATECASELGGKQMFWNYINKLFEVTPSNNGLDESELSTIATGLGLNRTAFSNCLSSGKYTQKISDSVNESQTAGMQGTPYSVMIVKNGVNDNLSKALYEYATKLGMPAGTILVTKDKKMIAVGGALPYDMIKNIIDLVLATN